MMTAFLQLYLANVKEFMRDRMALFWTLAFPIMIILLFGLVFSGGGNTTFDIGVAIEDRGTAGMGLDQALRAIPAFKVTEGARDALLDQLRHGKLRLVVVIPSDLSGAIGARSPAQVQVYYDPASQATAQALLAIIGKVVDGFEQQTTGRRSLLSVAAVSVAAENLRLIDFLLPGILGMSLMQLGLFATAPQLVYLREQQVLRRIGATPLPRATLLAAQICHRLVIGLIQTLLTILVGVLLFQFTIIGNLALVAGAIVLGTLTFIALGYLIAGLARSQESVNGVTQVFGVPMMFLSGLFTPIELMPGWLRPVAAILPLTYLADALRQTMVGATPMFGLALDFGVLAAWLVVCAALAVRFFRWE
jgi:ABC-2 type transport system permease protein